MNGIIPLYKEKGMTSGDCVYHLRKLLHERRIGHTGTLDPDVDGVLPICVGQATKLVTVLQNSGKIYRGELILGLATTTEDLSGEVIERQTLRKPYSDSMVDEAMAHFKNTITQIPPYYSAVKVKGKRLYEYARAHQEVERPQRQVVIYHFTRLQPSQFDVKNGQQRIKFEVACGKGTYVRTLATDLGKYLGVPAVMSQLTRIKSGGIKLEQTMTLAEIKTLIEDGQPKAAFTSIEEVLQALPVHQLSDAEYAQIKNGCSLPISIEPDQVEQMALSYHHVIKAIYRYDEEKKSYRPAIMLLRNEGIES